MFSHKGLELIFEEPVFLLIKAYTLIHGIRGEGKDFFALADKKMRWLAHIVL